MSEKVQQMLKDRGHSNPKNAVIKLGVPLNEPTNEGRKREIQRFFEGKGFTYGMESRHMSGSWMLEFYFPSREQVDPGFPDSPPRQLYVPEVERESLIRGSDITSFLRGIGAKILYDKMFSHRMHVVLNPTTDYQRGAFKQNIGPYITSRPSDFSYQ